MKKILVPTDFSKHAAYAAEVACQIARITGASIDLVHVISLPEYEDNVFSSFEEEGSIEEIKMREMLEGRFNRLLDLSFWKDISVNSRVEYGNVYQKISEIANKEDIGLLVTGSHGLSGENNEFVGSNVDKIVRLCNIPVLTIKKRTKIFQPNNIVFSSTFFEENKSVLSSVARIAEIYGANLHLLKVVTAKDFETTAYSEKLISDFASDQGLSEYTMAVINDHDVESGVYTYAKRVDAELICLATHGLTGWQRLFGKSISEDLSSHANEAVLSVKLNEKQEQGGVIFPE